MVWEVWDVVVTAKALDGRDLPQAVVRHGAQACREGMMEVVRVTGEEKDHIPLITNADVNPFPYEVVVVE